MKPDIPTDHAQRPAQLPPHQEISAKMSTEAFQIPVKASMAMPPKPAPTDMGRNVVAKVDVPAPAKVDLPVLHVGQPVKAGDPCPPGAAAAPRVEGGAHGPAAKPDMPAPKVDVPAPKVDVPAPKVEVPAPKVDVPAPKVEVPAPKPPVEHKPPVDKVPCPPDQKPPVEAPKPPVAPPPVEHKPPVDKVPCPPDQKPPVEVPKPPVEAPKPPVHAPKPPEHKPPVDKVPCPPEQKPPVEVPKPPVHAPKPPEHKPPVDKVPCPPDQKPPVEVPKPPVHAPKPPEHKPPVDKVPCPPEQKPPVAKPPEHKPPVVKPPEHKPPVDKTPCPPDKKPPEHKPPEHKPPEHKPPVDKTPCPPDKKPPEHKPPVDRTPCPPDKKPPVDTPPPPKPPVDTPCPPKPPVDTPPPPKPPVDTPPPPKPPVDTPPPPKPPVDVPPPPKPPVDVPPPPVPTPVPRPNPEVRPIAVRYSPPAEPMRPMLPEQKVIPPAAEVTKTPAAVRIETGSSEAEVTVERRREVTPAVRQEVPAEQSGKVIIQEGQHGSVTRENQVIERERGIIVPGHGRASEGHKAAAAETHTGIITGERQHIDRSKELRTQGVESTVVVDTKSGEGAQATQAAQVAETTRVEARAQSSAAVVEVQSPAAGADQVPGQAEYRKSWVDVGVSRGLHDKSTTGTVTLGTHLNDQNYIYGQTTRDLTNNKQGDSSLMYGHTILSPYNADGTVRRGNVNVEAGVLLGTGTALEGSKLPLFGHTAVRLGVNGYYSLDKEGKTNLYGGADYASSPKQADATIGIAHTMGDVTIAAGYQVSKVAGYEAARYITPSATVKISDRTSFYVGAAISAQGQHKEDRVNAGFRIAF